ncbi:MAG: hypothetical protein BJ554DRAFT_3493, partial [Olpidium bornovanus]
MSSIDLNPLTCIDSGATNHYYLSNTRRARSPFTSLTTVLLMMMATDGASFVEGHFVDSYYPTIENTLSKNIKYKGNEYCIEIIDTAGQVWLCVGVFARGVGRPGET